MVAPHPQQPSSSDGRRKVQDGLLGKTELIEITVDVEQAGGDAIVRAVTSAISMMTSLLPFVWQPETTSVRPFTEDESLDAKNAMVESIFSGKDTPADGRPYRCGRKLLVDMVSGSVAAGQGLGVPDAVKPAFMWRGVSKQLCDLEGMDDPHCAHDVRALIIEESCRRVLEIKPQETLDFATIIIETAAMFAVAARTREAIDRGVKKLLAAAMELEDGE